MMNIVPRNSLFDIDRLFDHSFFRGLISDDNTNLFAPRVDIHEKKNKYLIEAELPGVEQKDLNVEIDHGTLTIEAKTEREDIEEKEGRVIRRERQYGSYQRSFYLGEGVDENAIKASFKNGILKLDIPKPKKVADKSKRIAID